MIQYPGTDDAVVVLGAGAWGTAVALAAHRAGAGKRAVWLCTRHNDHLAEMQRTLRNQRYLPDHALPSSLQLACYSASSDAWQSLPQQACWVLAAPVAGLADQLTVLLSQRPHAHGVWLCKGLNAQTSQMAHEVAHGIHPELLNRFGPLTGPSFAHEVAHALPTALVFACKNQAWTHNVSSFFHHDSLRVYGSTDVIGAEVGGAVKNIMAIAAGLCDGLALGANARAALVTRGLAEMTRFALALGAQPETLMGLSGMGDLLLTTSGDLSRNRRVGLGLAQGHSLSQVLTHLGHVAEGVYCAEAVHRRAQQLHVEMPITAAVVAVLQGHIKPEQAAQQLMQRDARAE